MEVEHILRHFAIILGAGLAALFVATFLRVPEMIVLVAAGALIGPKVLGFVENPLNGVGAQLTFVARPVTVVACLLPDRCGERTRNEIAFLS